MSPVLANHAFVRPYINLEKGKERPDGVNTIPELIEFVADYNPDHVFGLQCRAGDGTPPCSITFSQLHSAVESAAGWLVNIRATSGRTRREQVVRPVAIFSSSDIGVFIYMAALLRIGTPVLLISARLTAVGVAHLVKQTASSTVLVGSHVSRVAKEALLLLRSESAHAPVPNFINALGYEDFLFPDHPTLRELQIPSKFLDYNNEDLDALIMHTSGTTGLPKPVYHSQRYLLEYPTAHRFPERQDPFHFSVSTLPLYHAYGLISPSLSLSIGLPFVLSAASTIPTGSSTLATIQATGATVLLSVPSIVEDIMRLPNGVGLDALRSLEVVAVGGAPIKENIGSELVAAGVNLLNQFGSTETGPIGVIEPIPQGYDWRYVMPRTDLDFRYDALNDGTGAYRMTCRPPGWKVPLELQDLLIFHPHDLKQFRLLGRADELLMLATGEKVRPSGIERAVAEHPSVKDVLAFGEGQLSLGLLVEVCSDDIDLSQAGEREAMLVSLEPYLERGNSFTDKHGKVTKEMIVFTSPTKRLLRSDKGSLLRKANYVAFEAEITTCYDHADMLKAISLPLPDIDKGAALLIAIRSLVKVVMELDDMRSDGDAFDALDFFEAGMDSLQASRLRKLLLSGLRVTAGLPSPVQGLDLNFVFQNSTVEKLHCAIAGIMRGADSLIEAGKAGRIELMEAMVEEYHRDLASYADLAAQARNHRTQNGLAYDGRAVILLTGSTGSLGCFLLSRLANDPRVSKVLCFNRPSQTGSEYVKVRQEDLMKKRGASISSDSAWDKIVFYDTEMSKVDFGLGKDRYAELLGVTHIIHNAWPVNFNRNLSSFEPHVKALSNLVRLSILSAGTRSTASEPVRILFTSSISVVGRFSQLHPQGPSEVPEIALDAANTAEFGYPEAKWVGEHVLMAAAEMYGQGPEALLKTSNVRIGQMTGPEGSGAWNENEHFPIIVRASQALGALPDLHGTVSWMPVNRASDAIADLLFSRSFKPFYHIENPSRQSWPDILRNISYLLGNSENRLSVIPFPEWLDRVRALGDDPKRNTAYKILGYLEDNFRHEASGIVILDTSMAKEDSPTMVESGGLGVEHLREYLGYWKSVGVLM